MLRILIGLSCACGLLATDIEVSPQGSVRTLAEAQRIARRTRATRVHVHAGVYYLPSTLVFTEADSGLTYTADPGVVVSGGVRLLLSWIPYREGIYQAHVPAGLNTDQLFVNGERQPMARYPNFDASAQYFNGWSPDAFSKNRASRWANPAGGFMHAMHRHLWGDFHYEITGKSSTGELQYVGGWQNNRQLGMHDQYRFVENIFEELDAPGEWFLDTKTSTLYFYPPRGVNIATAIVEAVVLRQLIEVRRAKHMRFDGFTFRHTARTFMDNREPRLRSDWTIFRGGAVFLSGTEDVAIENAVFDQVGGNAIFVSNYNRRVTLRGCHIFGAGANGIAFVGDPAAVRSPLYFGKGKDTQNVGEIDRTPGPLTENYPADSLVEECLIHTTGRFEKQTSPIEISMSRGITVRHCSLYDVPRAGINVSEGTWGGHLIEYCDVFDTVKETGDHGSFNSWGRDRYWGLKGVDLNALVTPEDRALPLLDAGTTTLLRNNRWRCDHGWDVDLDDGSSNYEIVNNLCLRGGLKLREGFQRRVENNVIVGNTFHPHVWYQGSGDVFLRNIVSADYKAIRMTAPWGAEIDFNLMHRPGTEPPHAAAGLQRLSGRDQHSLEGDALFVDADRGDYRVRDGSAALGLGFHNFAMDRFGVTKPELRQLAQTPKLPTVDERPAMTLESRRDRTPITWMGATVRNVTGLGDVSAAGLAGETGAIVLEAPAGSAAARLGLRRDDVVLALDGTAVDNVARLKPAAKVKISRGQVEVTLSWWQGFARSDSDFAGRVLTVVSPEKGAEGKPWLWRGEFFGAFATVDEALLKLGWHVVYLACPNTFGAPDTMERWSKLYDELTGRGFSHRPVLLGMSRGGLYVYNWAALHPEKTGLIYGDAPVCDVNSWPGGRDRAKKSPHDWELFKRVYGFSEEQAMKFQGSPIDILAPIARARIPIIHVVGDADEVVPVAENTLLLKDRYEALGGHVELIRKPELDIIRIRSRTLPRLSISFWRID